MGCGLSRSLLSLCALCSSCIRPIDFGWVGRDQSLKLLAGWQLMHIVASAGHPVCSSCLLCVLAVSEQYVSGRQAKKELDLRLLIRWQLMWFVAGAWSQLCLYALCHRWVRLVGSRGTKRGQNPKLLG